MYSAGLTQQTYMKLLARVPGNNGCFECDNKIAEWASVTLGILLCVDCAGVHRSFGVGTSFVRSGSLGMLHFLLPTAVHPRLP